MDQRMDQLIASGTPEMILVFPDCFTKYGGSQYCDSIATGAYRSYLLREVIPFVDSKFRTIARREGRGVLGKSSGGYGAITIAIEHPQLFSAVACHSGDMYFEYAYLPEFPLASRGLEKNGGLNRCLEHFDTIPKTGREDHALLNLIAMSACYSPNPNTEPRRFDLPIQERTGELIPPVWQKWKEKDPVEMIRRNPAALSNFGLIYLDCGRRDEFFLDLGARMFTAEMQKAGIPYIYEEFEEGHFNVQHRYDISLKKLADFFSDSCAGE
jgi:enterochelin esterase family protein